MNNSYILVLRDNVLYKAPLSMLSSIIVTNAQVTQCSSNFENIVENIKISAENYSDSHYTKSEMKSEFCSISSVSNLTANATYVLSNDANNKANNVLSKTNVDNWYRAQATKCAEVFIKEYGRIHEFMKQDDGGEHKMVEWAVTPDVEDLLDSDTSQNPQYGLS